MPTRSEQRRINIQQGKPMNEGLEDRKTCKDCIHYDVCAKYNKVYERELSHRYCTECKDFKDKSRYIELPCAEMKYVRDPNRIYTIMDFEDGEKIEFAYYPAHPQSYAKSHVFYRSKKDGRTMLLTKEDLERCNHPTEKGGVE